MSPEQRAWLVHLITTARFRPVRIREGYRMAEVDDLLDQLVTALGADRPIEGLVDGAQLTRVKWREGYRSEDVDELLRSLQAEAARAQ